METQKSNLFIVDDDKLIAAALNNYLDTRFGRTLNISKFYDGKSCLKQVDNNTEIVILDYNLKEENGLDVLKSIKSINPKTEVIMLTNNEDVGTAIESYKKGASGYVVKNTRALSKLNILINRIITEPLRAMVREFGVNKFMAIFFLTFAIMGTVVYLILHFFYRTP